MARDTLDLRGVKCPLSWARAKVHLETLATVVGVVDEGGRWRITIEV